MKTAQDSQAAGSDTNRPKVVWALSALSLCMLLPSLGTSIANVALPTLAAEFDAPVQHVQWVVLAYLLSMTTLLVSAGRLGDLVGRKRLLTWGLVWFAAASALCAVAPGLGWLIAARALQGAGAAVLMALTMAFVGEAIPKSHTGRAMGLLGAMSSAGTALGPTLGGLLIAQGGWPAIFFVSVPLGLAAWWLVRRCLPADGPRPAGAAAFDHVGTWLLAMTLGAYALAVTLGRGHVGLVNVGLLVVAGAALVLFVQSQRTVRSPLIRLAVLRDAPFVSSLVANALVSTVVMASLVVGPFYLAQALGLGAAQVGLALSVAPAAAALTGVPAGRLVDRFGPWRVAVAGPGLMVGGCVVLCLVPSGWGLTGYLVPLVAVTIGYALFQAANNTAVMTGVLAAQRGVMSGLLNLSRNLGLITGASLMGTVFVVASAAAPGAEAASAGLRVTFAVAAALAVAALLAARGARRDVRP